jgi:hypothetical protein
MFHRPFTLAQREKAVAILRSMKATHANMRKRFRPSDQRSRSLMQEYRELAVDFANVLKAEDAKVDVGRLNAILIRSNAVGLEYVFRRNSLPGSSGDD